MRRQTQCDSEANSCTLLGHCTSRKGTEVMQPFLSSTTVTAQAVQRGQFTAVQKETLEQLSQNTEALSSLQPHWLYWCRTSSPESTIQLSFLGLPAQDRRSWDCCWSHALSSVLNSIATLPAEYRSVLTGSEVSLIPTLGCKRKKNLNQSIRESNCIEMLSS